jgi:hypothetical protein
MTVVLPQASDSVSTAILSRVAPALQALASLHQGASAPATKWTGMLWADTSIGVLKQWDGSAWHVVGPIYANGSRRTLKLFEGALVGGESFFVPPSADRAVVSRITLVSDTATVGSDGSNNWSLQVHNLTAATTMFATAPTTNGDEFAADTAWSADVDQNATIAADDVLEVRVTKTGTPTSLAAARVAICLDLYPRST